MNRSTGKTSKGATATASASRDREAVLREQVQVEKEGWRLAGTLFRTAEGAATTAAAARPAIALVSDAASDEGAGRSLDTLAEALARAGMVALRVAPSSASDDKRTSSVDPGRDVRPIQLALDLVAAQPDVDLDHLALVGAGWSGVMATCVAEHDLHVAGVVIWEPQPAGSERGERDRAKAQADTPDVYGRFLERCRANGPQTNEMQRGSPLRVLIVHSTSNDAAQRVDPLRRALDHPGIQHEAAPIDSTAPDEAIERTVAWLQSTLIASE